MAILTPLGEPQLPARGSVVVLFSELPMEAVQILLSGPALASVPLRLPFARVGHCARPGGARVRRGTGRGNHGIQDGVIEDCCRGKLRGSARVDSGRRGG